MNKLYIVQTSRIGESYQKPIGIFKDRANAEALVQERRERREERMRQRRWDDDDYISCTTQPEHDSIFEVETDLFVLGVR